MCYYNVPSKCVQMQDIYIANAEAWERCTRRRPKSCLLCCFLQHIFNNSSLSPGTHAKKRQTPSVLATPSNSHLKNTPKWKIIMIHENMLWKFLGKVTNYVISLEATTNKRAKTNICLGGRIVHFFLDVKGVQKVDEAIFPNWLICPNWLII